MTREDHDAVIVGAGPCGLLTALLLARRGIDVVVLERNPGLINHPKAMGITRRTAEILQQLGLREEMARADLSAPDYALNIWAESLVGEEYGTTELQMPDPSITPYWSFHCPQTITEKVLLEAVEREPTASVRFGHPVQSFANESNGVQVSATFEGNGVEIGCRFMVAADGAGSPVRHALGIEAVGPGDQGHFINTYFRAPYGSNPRVRKSILHNILREGVFETFVSVNGGDLWLMHHFLQEGESGADYSAENLAEIIRSASGLPDVPVDVLSITQWVMSPKIAAQFQAGNIFLTGDASARLSPAGGLGMNTGLQSAHNLAWKLAAVLKGAPTSLLASYDAERRAHVMRTFETSNAFGSEVFEIVGAGMRGDFARVREIASHSRRSGSGLAIDLGWHYETGAFVPDPATAGQMDPSEFHPTAEPGRRAPHIWIERDGKKTSTLDLFGNDFVVLVAGDATPWENAASGCTVVSIPDGKFAEACELEPGGAVLVRPDGVVGWRSKTASPEGLAPALDDILAGGPKS